MTTADVISTRALGWKLSLSAITLTGLGMLLRDKR